MMDIMMLLLVRLLYEM